MYLNAALAIVLFGIKPRSVMKSPFLHSNVPLDSYQVIITYFTFNLDIHIFSYE